MSDDYTPTTEEVEAHWADVGFAGDRASFRRWLSEHDRQVAEDAWWEGAIAGHAAAVLPEPLVPNPYRRSTALQGAQEESKA